MNEVRCKSMWPGTFLYFDGTMMEALHWFMVEWHEKNKQTGIILDDMFTTVPSPALLVLLVLLWLLVVAAVIMTGAFSVSAQPAGTLTHKSEPFRSILHIPLQNRLFDCAHNKISYKIRFLAVTSEEGACSSQMLVRWRHDENLHPGAQTPLVLFRVGGDWSRTTCFSVMQ